MCLGVDGGVLAFAGVCFRVQPTVGSPARVKSMSFKVN